ncbi:hypothetical protein [Desulfobotulus alkaliphilus]|uniref:hypothetical protein n=1 Tax=Desulfobotulus alkaliphilus TaxID=622671 RepID=UPI001C97F548|nr:hypothetical protein [Desulfobotulus alkaliphilus]
MTSILPSGRRTETLAVFFVALYVGQKACHKPEYMQGQIGSDSFLFALSLKNTKMLLFQAVFMTILEE